jgi:hypothetical protein
MEILTYVDDVLEGRESALHSQRDPLESYNVCEDGIPDDVPAHQSASFVLEQRKVLGVSAAVAGPG